MFIMQVVATVLTLADLEHIAGALNRYVLISLYLQWLGMMCAALLCWLRAPLMRLPPRLLFLACWAVLLVVTLAVSETAWKVSHWANLPLIATSQEQFVLSNLCISSIVS